MGWGCGATSIQLDHTSEFIFLVLKSPLSLKKNYVPPSHLPQIVSLMFMAHDSLEETKTDWGLLE